MPFDHPLTSEEAAEMVEAYRESLESHDAADDDDDERRR